MEVYKFSGPMVSTAIDEIRDNMAVSTTQAMVLPSALSTGLQAAVSMSANVTTIAPVALAAPHGLVHPATVPPSAQSIPTTIYVAAVPATVLPMYIPLQIPTLGQSTSQPSAASAGLPAASMAPKVSKCEIPPEHLVYCLLSTYFG